MKHRFLLALAMGLLAPSPGHGHDAARWIMRDADIAWCCGPEDCAAVPGRVRFTPPRWSVDGLDGVLTDGDLGLSFRPTPDGGPWACRFAGTDQLRCLILPRSTM